MSKISTHILDLAAGKPAQDVPVHLEVQRASGWRVLASHRTDQDGRCTQLLPQSEALAAAIYRLRFDVADYYAVRKVSSLYPVIEITFEVRAGESQFHIPLLLNANGYTTYRGS